MTKLRKQFQVAMSVLSIAIGIARQAEATLVLDETAILQNYTVRAHAKHLIAADGAHGTVASATTFVDGQGTVVSRVLMLTVGELLQVDVGGGLIGPNGTDSYVVAALGNLWRGVGEYGVFRGRALPHSLDGRFAGLATLGSNGAFWGDRGQSGLSSLVVAQANSLSGTSAGGGGGGGTGSSGRGSGSGSGSGGGAGYIGSVQGSGSGSSRDGSNPGGAGASNGGNPSGDGHGSAPSGGEASNGGNPGGGGTSNGGGGDGGGFPGGGGSLDPGVSPPGESGGSPGNGPDPSELPFAVVPEPSTLAYGLIGAGLGLSFAWVRRRKARSAWLRAA